MRTLSPQLQAAIDLPQSSRPYLMAQVTPQSTYLDTVDSNEVPADWSNPDPYPFCYLYDVLAGEHRTLFNRNGTLIGMNAGSYTEYSLGISVPAQHQPALIATGTGGMYLFYASTNGSLYRATLQGWTVTATQLVSGAGAFASTVLHAPAPDTLAVFRLDNGGVTPELHYVSPVSGVGWVRQICPRRFVFPSRNVTDIKELRFSAAAKAGGYDAGATRAFFYLSDVQGGSVRGVFFDYRDTDWSGIFEAVPADLSRFQVTCAFGNMNTGMVRLAGVFSRTQELATPGSYLMLAESSDGRTFSLHPQSLIYTNAWPYKLSFANSRIYAGYGNLIISGPDALVNNLMGLALEQADILSFNDASGFSASSASLVLANGDERFTDHAYLTLGSQVVVWAGYAGAGPAPLRTIYGTYLITGLEEGYANGERSLKLDLTHEGLERIATFGHPFYTEIANQAAHHDTLADKSNFYPAPRSGITHRWLYCDFWNCKPYSNASMGIKGVDILNQGGVDVFRHSGSHFNGVMTADLKEHLGLVDYPGVIAHPGTGAVTQIDAALYVASLSAAAGGVADSFQVGLLVVNASGVERELWGGLTSSYSSPPQTYAATSAAQRPGSYPITFQFPGANFAAGDRIKAILVNNGNTVENLTVYSGVKLSGLAVSYDDGHMNTGWDHTLANGVGTLSLERPGRPVILFSRKPDHSAEFEVWARFGVPVLKINSSLGLVGFARDGLNYAFGRHRATADNGSGVAEIGLVREGITYVLGSVNWNGISGGGTLLFAHRGGRFSLRFLPPGGSIWQVLLDIPSTSLAYGPPAVGEDLMHVGLYGYLAPQRLQVCAYTYKNSETAEEVFSDGLAILPGWETDFDPFPASGQLRIEDSTFTYTSKFTASYRGQRGTHGPYQAKRTSNWSDSKAVDFTLFDFWQARSALVGGLMASDNGYTWEVQDSLWQLNPFQVRSRHFGDHVSGNYVGTNNRMYVAEGFKGITGVDDPKSTGQAAWAFLDRGEKIVAQAFGAAGGELNATLSGMLARVCRMSRVTPRMADYNLASLRLTGTTTVNLKPYSDFSLLDFEISMYMPPLGVGEWIGVQSQGLFTISGQTGNIIAVMNQGGKIHAVALNQSYQPILSIQFADTLRYFVRFVFHGNFCSMFDGEAWMHTFMFENLQRSEVGRMQIGLVANPGNTKSVTQLKLVELAHWREAVPIDLTASTQSVLSSIIQERPVLLAPRSDGSVLFSYFTDLTSLHAPAEYSLNPELVYEVRRLVQKGSQVCSDAILYYEDVAAVKDFTAARLRGFQTRILSLPNIESDEIYLVSRILMRNALEEEERYRISLRPDLRVEVGDIVRLNASLSGTGTARNLGRLLVENVNLDAGTNKMVIMARKRVVEVQG